jgi:hypothetical protein
MGRSVYLAKLIGPLLVAIGLGLVLSTPLYRAMGEEFLRSPALIYLSGLLILPAGVAIIMAHNVWAFDWRVIITILGWMGAISGAIRIILPQAVGVIGGSVINGSTVPLFGGAVVLLLGGVLCFFGYRLAP